jgi:hypothetical protein
MLSILLLLWSWSFAELGEERHHTWRRASQHYWYQERQKLDL